MSNVAHMRCRQKEYARRPHLCHRPSWSRRSHPEYCRINSKLSVRSSEQVRSTYCVQDAHSGILLLWPAFSTGATMWTARHSYVWGTSILRHDEIYAVLAQGRPVGVSDLDRLGPNEEPAHHSSRTRSGQYQKVMFRVAHRGCKTMLLGPGQDVAVEHEVSFVDIASPEGLLRCKRQFCEFNWFLLTD